jgi:molybdate transport system substrate-binding protein
MRSVLTVICVAVGMTWPGEPALAARPPIVAAAADLKFALAEVAARFAEDTGHELRLSYGSSGNFAHQILHGAPYELFLSADEAYVFLLAERGLTRDRGTLYATGRLVLFAPHGAEWTADRDLAGLRAALAARRITRFAIANPEHAPYGRAAREILRAAGLWDDILPLLVLGENAAQATQFATSGAAQGGIIPLALALVPRIAAQGTYALLPAAAHAPEPLRQRMVLLSGAGAIATAFYAYMQQPQALAILTAYGFIRPGDPDE